MALFEISKRPSCCEKLPWLSAKIWKTLKLALKIHAPISPTLSLGWRPTYVHRGLAASMRRNLPPARILSIILP